MKLKIEEAKNQWNKELLVHSCGCRMPTDDGTPWGFPCTDFIFASSGMLPAWRCSHLWSYFGVFPFLFVFHLHLLSQTQGFFYFYQSRDVSPLFLLLISTVFLIIFIKIQWISPSLKLHPLLFEVLWVLVRFYVV